MIGKTMIDTARRIVAGCAFIALNLVWVAPAAAASPEIPKVITPPDITADPNGVNLLTGQIMSPKPTLSIPAAPRLTYTAASDFAMYADGQRKISTKGGFYSVNYGGLKSESFRCTDSMCNGIQSVSGFSAQTIGPSTYGQEKTGVIYHFNVKVSNYDDETRGLNITEYMASQVIYPDGEELSLEYEPFDPDQDSDQRLIKVSSNTGYYLQFEYWDSLAYGLGWAKVKTVAIYADGNPATPLGQLSYSSDGKQVTDLAGRSWSCALDCGQYALASPWRTTDTVSLPGEASAAFASTSTPGSAFAIQSISRDGVNWNYSYSGLASYMGVGTLAYKYDSVTVTGPNGYQRVYEMGIEDHSDDPTYSPKYKIDYVKSSTDEFGNKTNYTYEDYTWRLTGILKPEGNEADFEYDTFGNLIKQTDHAKPGSGLSDVIQEAYYDPSYCPDVRCWRPIWSRDAKGNQTDFTYNSVGQLIQRVEPADAQGIRRITINTYSAGGSDLSRLASTRICGGTGTTCSGSDYSRVDYDYWNDTLLLSAERHKDPVTGEVRTTSYAYNAAGRLLSVDGPLGGASDQIFYRYDAAGRKTWEIGALAPNGLRIATRTHYRDADDKPDYVETGTLTSPTDTNLVVFDRVDTTYDGKRNPVRVSHSAGGTTYAVTDRSFLDRGLAECTAIRMNPAAFTATPGACDLVGQGSYEPDRVTHNIYDNRGQLVQVRKRSYQLLVNGVLQATEIADATYTYTDNGLMKFVIDANGNKAELRYDGFDRQSKWVFPSQAKPTGFIDSSVTTVLSTAGSLNENDYEAYGYDASGNRTSLKKRDNTDIAYTYDNLNRMTVKNVDANNERSDLASADEQDVYYSYDLNGVQTSARFGSASGNGIVTVPNGFGEITSSTDTLLSGNPVLAYQYDKAGNVTSLIHPDGAQFDFAYDALNRIATIKHDTTTLIAPSYADRGLISGVDRYNAALDQSFGYDSLGRLNALDIGVSGQTNSAKVGWDYTRNSASQISTEVRDNALYAWTGKVGGFTDYAANGLNQYSAISSTALCYDANGNLTDDGVNSYKYDIENRLVEMRARNGAGCPSYTGGTGYSGQILAALHYDPLGRLAEALKYESGALTKDTRFLYDGDALTLEYSHSASGSDTIASRYVHGNADGADDPLIWYNGAGIADTDIRNLYADPRGSIVLVQGQDGTQVGINTYDEWGNNEGDQSTGRFQYTGQVYLDELGMYYYKARIYSPVIGRFMQADPIGYKDQVNLYAYVGNDPVDGSDPSGNFSCVSNGNGTQRCTSNGSIADNAALAVYAAYVYADRAVRQVLHNDPEPPAPPPPDGQRPGKTPNEGEPGSTHVNPGSGQVRVYGSDGKPIHDTDHDHNHGGVGVPHEHDWTRAPDGTPIRGPARPPQITPSPAPTVGVAPVPPITPPPVKPLPRDF